MTIDLNFDKNHLWHPYTSTTHPLPCYPVKSTQGVRIEFEDGTQVIDGMASWWSAIHGYNVPEINQAIIEQTQTMAHVMFGGLTHEPAVDLGKKLVDITPDALQKVFLADSGSIAVEVALKMAMQYWAGKNKPNKSKIVTVNNGYHGDTFGAMSVCDPVNGMHTLFESALASNLFLGEIPLGFDTPVDTVLAQQFEKQIAQQADELAAFIIEPIVQGAGGMRIYNPQWLALIRQWCDKYGLLLIADEIATGFGRTGKMFACEHANITPDILCLGKAISGGYMTLAATLATDDVAEGVCASEAGVFMHGPTFMGNPLACATANASLCLLIESDWQSRVRNIENQLTQALSPLRALNCVEDIRTLGAIGVMVMKEPVDTASTQNYFIERGVWVRPFGKIVYIMPAYVIREVDLTTITDAMIGFANATETTKF
ncbi:adenosylmethionine--8-amino-7-oxononanoate transaminase [Reinekea marina]|uniref:Adenosylmethionine-8-amino-7-oxononanoate aminotransferase n=1 Tax=Reinekea marina TaxID=1310421 RepID=A0ABV7WMY4_9GAMM|nr:adenosylmethionine--8-amino-7-oxononanoate transaminase [Reinekea marina]MDN3649934.1 adenosylmethionine--8-amino-7-oxononanoate transaminase [Reinekea marina]